MKAQRRGLLVGLAVLSLGAFVGLGGNIQPQPARAQTSDVATANLINTAGQPVGTARFIQQGREVIVEASVSSLAPGFHGFHVHAIGVCDPAATFTTAGGHHNPTGAAHAGHSGDMPSLHVNTDGTGRLTVALDTFNVTELLEGDGSAVMIHADPDNFAWFPARYGVTPDETTLNTGDAGARVACGVIERTTG